MSAAKGPRRPAITATVIDALRVVQPGVISVSGGRTSGYMLRRILDAHGGLLPQDVLPIFCNTGREHEATLQFVRDMAANWSTPIVWLEYRSGKKFEVVDYCRASRNGEPFSALIDDRKYLPNPVTRFCTTELKIRTTARFVKSLGWTDFTNAIGLRADEPRRVARMNGDSSREGVVMPLASMGVTKADVMEFWKRQAFDLQLPGDDPAYGNCDLCFLKGRGKIEKVIQTDPSRAEWWAQQEERIGSTFRRDRKTYRQMMAQLTIQGRAFDDTIEDDTLPCQCHD